jgi:hypothetical protein
MSDDLEIEAQRDTKRILGDDDAPDQSDDLARLELDDLWWLERDIETASGRKPTPTRIPVMVAVPSIGGVATIGKAAFMHIDRSVLEDAIEEDRRTLYECIRKAKLRKAERG